MTSIACSTSRAFRSCIFVSAIERSWSRESFPTFDGNPGIQYEWAVEFAGNGYQLHKLTIFEHTGTHIDAPFHFSADGKSVDQIEPQQLVAPLAIIGCIALYFSLPLLAILVLPVWGGLGLIIYFAYSRRRSHVGRGIIDVPEASPPPEPQVPGGY